jgi:hypothetical protein
MRLVSACDDTVLSAVAIGSPLAFALSVLDYYAMYIFLVCIYYGATSCIVIH